MSSHLRLEVEGAVATLKIDRPEKRNAMSLEMWAAIPDLIDRVDGDEHIKVLVVRGDDHFSAGADISEFATVRSGAAGGRAYNATVDAAEVAVADLAKPTIAAVTGFCIGGGCELALACDMRIASEEARLAITPAKLGLVYTLRSTRTLVETVGPAWARQILFTGDQLDARQALQIGLVNEVHPRADLNGRVQEVATTIAERAQVAVRSSKDIVRRVLDGQLDEDDSVHALYEAGYASDDYAEGVAAFAAKRTPDFG